ncbi:MAG: winged helix-turn-helix transcriptional regulator [Flavobacteriaceae bacterium]|nr:MAG: winged helix-turn-helix transcriptional regulator [Flavobacteriaceae bacterium]
MKLDPIDKKIINLLQRDCKQTHKNLSLFLNLSVTAVYERIKKLEKHGFITGYVTLIDKNKVNRSFLVFCHVRLLQHSKGFLVHFEKEVLKLDKVSECFHVSGDYDYILKIHVENMSAYREFMVRKLTIIQHIGNTHSIFTIHELKNTTEIVL